MSEVSEGKEMLPTSAEEATDLLKRILIPPPIRLVAETLQKGGHCAVLVGGSVRDALLGRLSTVSINEQSDDRESASAAVGDWDVATSATPQEVQSLFRRTIPTGIEHGTVTVLSGRGDEREAVEVTTFRGEGAYHDGRRPSEVRFLRELEDDLARRDFTVNAFAWDPIQEVFTDAFDGLRDLNARKLRAVGDAQTRFEEDGLRPMRAVRFAATLQFELEASTESAIAPTLEIFARVARERVRVELFKLLASPRPSLGLAPMLRTGLWGRVLTDYDEAEAEKAIRCCDLLPADPCLRLARLLRPLNEDAAMIERIINNLKPSREERDRLIALSSVKIQSLREGGTPLRWREVFAQIGRQYLEDALMVAEFDKERVDELLGASEGVPLRVGELAIKGGELISSGKIPKGPQVGECMRQLLRWVWEDPDRNTKDQLLAAAEKVVLNA